MSFHSEEAYKIWDNLYTVIIPDALTTNRDYLRKFGGNSTGDKKLDASMGVVKITVKIPIIKILEYFEDGIEVEIPSRADMIQIHKDIESYLYEWREHIKYDINLDIENTRKLLLTLEKLSKVIYEKASGRELIDKLLDKTKGGLGLINPLQRKMEQSKEEEVVKKDYQGLSELLRKKPKGRFG